MPLSALRLLHASVAMVVATAVALAGVVLVPGPSHAELPIEGYPSYQPQERCSPTDKPGTLALAAHLLARYPGSVSSGISRSCGASGTSEHKEGRAFDWGLSVGSARDRGYAQDFLARLLAEDRRGNPAALARRMGVMYVIWNDRVWSSWSEYQPRRYLHGACEDRKTCSTTLRHRDHMHISLTWQGARGETSWYAGRVPASPKDAEPNPRPAPAPSRSGTVRAGFLDLTRRDYARVRVPATGTAVRTRFKLEKGRTYTITAAGLYGFGGPAQAADAVCTWSSRDDAWVPKPSDRVLARYGRLTLLVNGRRILGNECRPASHVYRAQHTPRRDGPLTLNLPGPHPDSSGGLTVVVSRNAKKSRAALPSYPPMAAAPAAEPTPPTGYALLSETVTLDPRRAGRTARSLHPRATYRVTVSGSVGLGRGVRADGRCVAVGDRWYRKASIDLRAPGADHGKLFLDGTPFEGRPVAGRGCGERGYTTTYSPRTEGRLRLDVWDPLDRADNTGSLSVRIQRLTGFAEPRSAKRAAPRPKRRAWKQPRDWFEVRSDAPGGTVSRMRLRKGEQVMVVVRGTHRSHGREADASCVRTDRGWTLRDRDLAVAEDPLELWVDGRTVSWRALGKVPLCSEREHGYVTRFTAHKPGPLRLAVHDLDHRDNRGVLSVTLLRVRD